jgi:CRP-like cAMP-binding protein
VETGIAKTEHRRGSESEPRGRGMQSDARQRRLGAVSTHPLAELLSCPPAPSNVLTASARTISFGAGETVFSQSTPCLGLYLVVSGQFLRRAERLSMRVMLGMARAGDLVELAAALGDGIHTYTLISQTPGSVLLLPREALHQAFQSYPPLQMRLLEELAREVSRAYHLCTLTHLTRARRRSPAAATA